jgi:hypothetical protein
MTTLTKRVAAAMEAKRAELINQPLARVWEELASVAVDVAREELEGEAYEQGKNDALDAEQYGVGD